MGNNICIFRFHSRWHSHTKIVSSLFLCYLLIASNHTRIFISSSFQWESYFETRSSNFSFFYPKTEFVLFLESKWDAFHTLISEAVEGAPGQRSPCGFKSSIPPPPHTHILVLSLHSKCQAVTSTIVSRTRRSLLYREEGRGARERRRWWGRASTNPAMFPEDESLPRHNPQMLFMAALPIRSPAPLPCKTQPPPGCPLITGACVHRVGVLPARGL